MRHPQYAVRFFDRYGRVITTISITVPLREIEGLPQAIADAGDKAFGKDWGRAVVLQGMRLTVDNPKEAGK